MDTQERRDFEQYDMEQREEWIAEMRGYVRHHKPKRVDEMANLEKDIARAKIANEALDRKEAELTCPFDGCVGEHSCKARV